MTALAGQDMWALASPHHQSISTGTFEGRAQRRHQAHKSASCKANVSSNCKAARNTGVGATACIDDRMTVAR
ncbi:MAG TPA: hypothetical protein VFS23_37195, partial [Vicinamibacterales bacterium]|nr:hypothetical protein [Vicinamibacterales bacterium]